MAMVLLLPAEMKEYSEETRRVSPAHFLVRVRSFSLLTKNGVDKYESRSFEAGGYKWKLILNFGCEKEEEQHVSVYFSIAESDALPHGWEVNAICTFFVHNQLLDCYSSFRGMTRSFNAVSPKWGFSNLMPRKELIDPSKGYVVDDSCVFGAEVFVIKTQRVNECLSLLEDTYPFKRDWKISRFSKVQDEWKSEEFYVEDHTWYVKVYPKGETGEERYVSIFVECVDSKKFAPHQKLKAAIRIRLKSNLNCIHQTRNFTHWFASSSPNWGYDDFIPIADMTSKGFLVDDCCHLEIKIILQALALDAPKT